MGLSGLPSILIIFPSRTLTICPQPTAQYGQTLGTSFAPLILSRRVASWAARRSPPKLSQLPNAKPPTAEVRKKSRRDTLMAGVDMVLSPAGGMKGVRLQSVQTCSQHIAWRG